MSFSKGLQEDFDRHCHAKGGVMKIIISALVGVIVFVLIIAYGIFIYWVGGGEFERGHDLAFTLGLCTVVGLFAIIPALKIYDYLNKPKEE